MFESLGNAWDAVADAAGDAKEQLLNPNGLEANETYDEVRDRLAKDQNVPDDYLEVLALYDLENGTDYQSRLRQATDAGDETTTESIMTETLDELHKNRLTAMAEEFFPRDTFTVSVHDTMSKITINPADAPPIVLIKAFYSDDFFFTNRSIEGYSPNYKNPREALNDVSCVIYAIRKISQQKNDYEDRPFTGLTSIWAKKKDGKQTQVFEGSQPGQYADGSEFCEFLNDLYYDTNHAISKPPAPSAEVNVDEPATMAGVREALAMPLEDNPAVETVDEAVAMRIDSPEAFRQALKADPSKYLKSYTDSKSTDFNINLPAGYDSPEVQHSRIQHFIGKDGYAAIGLNKPEEYQVFDRGNQSEKYRWVGGTWKNSRGQRLKVRSGLTQLRAQKIDAGSDLLA